MQVPDGTSRAVRFETLTPTGPAPVADRPAADAKARARESLVHVLMNHNDFVTVR